MGSRGWGLGSRGFRGEGGGGEKVDESIVESYGAAAAHSSEVGMGRGAVLGVGVD